MRNLIVAATAALALAPTTSFAGSYVVLPEMPTFYEEFTQKADKASVAKEDTASPKIIAVKAKTEQDADN